MDKPKQPTHDQKAEVTQDLRAEVSSFTKDSPQVGAYGPQSVPQIDLTQKNWEEAKSKRGLEWNDDPKKRLAIRAFSRGVLGAAFFTAGGLLTRKWMTGERANLYNSELSLAQQNNPLQMIAKVIDTCVGRPIEAAVTAVAGREKGLRSVRFRETNWLDSDKEMHGRSLGAEVVGITFDFFCASVGDAFGRDIAAWIDPNAKKMWQDEKGHLSLSKAAQGMVDNTLRYITYNGGEDWAVAIPYAYFMKGQRNIINSVSPGFQNDFDRQLNGASFKMHDNKIVGNYNKEGVIDIQSRFTAYNIGTLMYREAYNYIGNLLTNKPAKLYGSPEDEQDKSQGILGKAADVVKWIARSAIKGTIIMTPAVPFFWSTRTPQTKHRALFIDPEKGVLGFEPNILPNTPNGVALHANTRGIPSVNTRADYWQYVPLLGEPLDRHFTIQPGTAIGNIDPALAIPHPNGNQFNSFDHTTGPINSVLNAAGKISHGAAHALTAPAGWIDRHVSGVSYPIKDWLGIEPHNQNQGRFLRPFVNASISYTPYMAAKAEFSNLWDDGKMDLAAEGLVDGVAHLNWGQFTRGVGEVTRAVLRKPFADPKREAEAQRRILVDTSAADSFIETKAEQLEDLKRVVQSEVTPNSNWRERVISGAPAKEKDLISSLGAQGGDGASLDAYKKPKAERQTVSLAEREAMRKALEELAPPTNAIN